MDDDVVDENLGEQLERTADEIVDYVEKYSPRPAVDADNAERLLEEAPPAQAAEELEKMVDGFRSGGGAATGRNSLPAPEHAPTDELDSVSPQLAQPWSRAIIRRKRLLVLGIVVLLGVGMAAGAVHRANREDGGSGN